MMNTAPSDPPKKPQDIKETHVRARQTNAKAMGIKAAKYTIIVIGVIILAISSFLWYVFYGPRWGTMHYGLCKVFAERYIDFPSTMRVNDVEYYGLNARVFISHIDASGQYNYNVVECEYGKGTFEITRIRIDRKVISDTDEQNPVRPEIIQTFNKGLDAILLNPPDLLLPHSTINSPLVDLWHGED